MWAHKHVILSNKERKHVKAVATWEHNQIIKARKHLKTEGT